MEIQMLIDEINEFREKRGWGKAHTPTNIAMSISIEAAELLENYQWGSEYADDENIKEELADILIYAFTLADLLHLNVSEIVREKMQKNAVKYPVVAEE